MAQYKPVFNIAVATASAFKPGPLVCTENLNFQLEHLNILILYNVSSPDITHSYLLLEKVHYRNLVFDV
jgi:hypothetical protein